MADKSQLLKTEGVIKKWKIPLNDSFNTIVDFTEQNFHLFKYLMSSGTMAEDCKEMHQRGSGRVTLSCKHCLLQVEVYIFHQRGQIWAMSGGCSSLKQCHTANWLSLMVWISTSLEPQCASMAMRSKPEKGWLRNGHPSLRQLTQPSSQGSKNCNCLNWPSVNAWPGSFLSITSLYVSGFAKRDHLGLYTKCHRRHKHANRSYFRSTRIMASSVHVAFFRPSWDP